jgi:insertion element IS1 protein InsB
MRTSCPCCGSIAFKKNGINQYGDQNHKCLECGRQFVLDPQNKIVAEETKNLIRKLLIEKLPIRAICRVADVSKTWLLHFIKEEYRKIPLDMEISIIPDSLGLILKRIEAEELWPSLGNRKRQIWLWVAFDAELKHVVAFHAGGKTDADALAFWEEVPEPYNTGCILYTDEWDIYRKGITAEKESLFEINSVLQT